MYTFKNCTFLAAKRFRFHILPSNTGMIFARTRNPELEALIKIYIYTTAIGLCLGGETLDRKRNINHTWTKIKEEKKKVKGVITPGKKYRLITSTDGNPSLEDKLTDYHSQLASRSFLVTYSPFFSVRVPGHKGGGGASLCPPSLFTPFYYTLTPL